MKIGGKFFLPNRQAGGCDIEKISDEEDGQEDKTTKNDDQKDNGYNNKLELFENHDNKKVFIRKATFHIKHKSERLLWEETRAKTSVSSQCSKQLVLLRKLEGINANVSELALTEKFADVL
eukprot:TRINITY_DN10290_c0_g6_i1.p1 TRINITY_DN10290_c0_g6~~TRINITY_DN10290_c0_g6_i1.p1  ORF type:complete len:121 (-),score=8.99 TRINITY_DN10290_c0_g6_i1:102-464(-)